VEDALGVEVTLGMEAVAEAVAAAEAGTEAN